MPLGSFPRRRVPHNPRWPQRWGMHKAWSSHCTSGGPHVPSDIKKVSGPIVDDELKNKSSFLPLLLVRLWFSATCARARAGSHCALPARRLRRIIFTFNQTWSPLLATGPVVIVQSRLLIAANVEGFIYSVKYFKN